MKLTHGSHRRDAGFSAIEIVVVLTLVALVAALAQPRMNVHTNRVKVRQALDRVTSDIALARMTAVRSGNRTVLEMTGPSSYRIRVEGANPDTLRVVSFAEEYAGVTLQAPTGDGRLVFNSRGLLLTPGTGLLVAQNAAGADTIRITAAGRIYRAY